MVNPANLQTAEETAPSLQHTGLKAVLTASEDTLDATQKRTDLGGLVFIIHVSCHFTSQHRMNHPQPEGEIPGQAILLYITPNTPIMPPAHRGISYISR